MDLKCPKCEKVLATKEEMAEHAKVHAKEEMDKMKSGLKLQKREHSSKYTQKKPKSDERELPYRKTEFLLSTPGSANGELQPDERRRFFPARMVSGSRNASQMVRNVSNLMDLS